MVDTISRQAAPSAFVIAGWGVAVLLGEVAGQWQGLVQTTLNDRCTVQIELLLMRTANRLELSAFDDRALHDSLQVLTRQSSFRPMNLMVTTANLLPGVVTVVTLSAFVATVAWWLPVVVVSAALPSVVITTRLMRESWQVTGTNSGFARVLRYLLSLATSAVHAKEVRLFGFGPFLEGRYRSTFEAMRRELRAHHRRRTALPLASVAILVTANLLAVGWTIRGALAGILSAGDVVLVLQSMMAFQPALGGIVAMVSLLGGHLLYFTDLFSFLDRRSGMKVAAVAAALPRPPVRGIRFSDVSFRYPSGALAVQGVSFDLRAGEKVALVGENGSGKSTLVKLLCRLYDPTGGAILVDGIDLREIDLDAWRRRIGAVFQDFGHYQFTVAENIALGDIGNVHDRSRLGQAVAGSGFGVHLDRLKAGLDTQLGSEFGGSDLSGGQWQTLGIARALFRAADVLILDEPTASLDPRAEHELFEHFAGLVRGRTALLVTHRLSSVVMADRILVVKQGTLVEEGTHRDLIVRGGEYAELFQLQAERYQSGPG
jgi:ABC-type multidrug transport system fused ATPase/permease subunit